MHRLPLAIALVGMLAATLVAAEPVKPPAEPVKSSAKPAPLLRLDGSTITMDEVDRFIVERMKTAKVTGLAVAILQRGEVAYVKAFGERGAERHLPLQVDTVLYGASFTKAMFGAVVGALADRRVIDLDRPVIELLNKPWAQVPKYGDLASDPRANQIYMLAFDKPGIGIVLMSNSDHGESIYRAILEKLIHDDVTPWAWEGYP